MLEATRAVRSFYAFVLAGLFMTVNATAQSGAAAERELKDLQDRWATARIKGDVDFLEKLYAKEFRIHAVDGSVVTRAEDIERFATKVIKPQVIADDEVEVTLYGDTALVTGREHVVGTYRDIPGEFWIRFTNVYVWRDSRWQMVMHQGTEVRGK